jgi:hypothetical protein
LRGLVASIGFGQILCSLGSAALSCGECIGCGRGARRIGGERHRFMISFFDRLDAEMQGKG